MSALISKRISCQSMERDQNVYLLEMLELIKNVKRFVGPLSREEFLQDHKTAASVLLEIIMLGEIAKRMPLEMQEMIPIPWKNIMGFRDRAIHDYSKIDAEIVAGIVYDRLDDVAHAIQSYLDDNSSVQ